MQLKGALKIKKIVIHCHLKIENRKLESIIIIFKLIHRI